MKFIYYFSVLFYGLLIRLAMPFSNKAKLWVKGRRNFFKNFSFQNLQHHKTVWFHVSSLGEFEQGRPVIEEYRKRYPQHKIVLTFFSPSGYEIRKNYSVADYICYLPLDTPRNAKKLIERINPSLVFFVKYDFWYFYIDLLARQKIPVYLISSIFRKNQLFFKPWGIWYARLLARFNHIFVQNRESMQLLQSINIKNVTLAGDTRIDRVHAIAGQQTENRIIQQFAANRFVIICGSTWPQDEDLIFSYLHQTPHDIHLIIAPHETGESHISRIQKLAGNKSERFTQIKENTLPETKILIIDTIGMLASLYRYGKFAYIGGGFGKGIHNILEPATFGLPVVFGPNFKKFHEAVTMISSGGAFTITNLHEITNIFNRLIEQHAFLEKASEISQSYIKNNLGATNLIFSVIEN